MRLTLIDVLIILPLLVVGYFAGLLANQWAQIPDNPLLIVFPLLCVLVVVLPIASLIYRWLHFRPLFIPRCPHCHKRPEWYGIVESHWPRQVIACRLCGSATELWYKSDADHGETATDMPSLHLRWPWFIGVYKRVR